MNAKIKLKWVGVSVYFLLTGMILGACEMNEKSGESITPQDDVKYSFFSGYWKVDTSTPVERRTNEDDFLTLTGKVENSSDVSATRTAGFSLYFYKPNEWLDYIYFSNNKQSESKVGFNDDIYIGFSVINHGPDTYSVYLGDGEGKVKIYWDGEFYDEYPIEFLQANYYETRIIPITNYYSNVDLMPGRHEIKLEISVSGKNSVIRTKNIDIEAPKMNANFIEFNESMYFVEGDNGTEYGYITTSGNKIVLNGYATLEVISSTEEKMVVEVILENSNARKLAEGFPVTLWKESADIPDTDMTKLLCNDTWILTESNGEAAVEGKKWIFGKSGSYRFINTSGHSKKYWGYVSENEISYGFTPGYLNGSSTITSLTSTRMEMEDVTGSKFIFEKE